MQQRQRLVDLARRHIDLGEDRDRAEANPAAQLAAGERFLQAGSGLERVSGEVERDPQVGDGRRTHAAVGHLVGQVQHATGLLHVRHQTPARLVEVQRRAHRGMLFQGIFHLDDLGAQRLVGCQRCGGVTAHAFGAEREAARDQVAGPVAQVQHARGHRLVATDRLGRLRAHTAQHQPHAQCQQLVALGHGKLSFSLVGSGRRRGVAQQPDRPESLDM
jgi:hypothetical protein